MSQFNIDEIEKRTLSGLKDFQRATVERVDYLFRHNQNRVLVMVKMLIKCELRILQVVSCVKKKNQ